MQFASLGSGSRGNCTLVEADGTAILIDCGFSIKETERRLKRLARDMTQISAILVTHEHGDHVRGVASLARKYKLPVWSSRGTAKAAKLEEVSGWQCIDIHQEFAINNIQIQPVPVPHDAREPCQFVFSDGDWRLGVLTDTGSITPYIAEQYSACDAFILEANHDEEMLANGPYPMSLKQRVGGDYGHLNNRQARDLLNMIDTTRLQYLVASHISDKNNTAELACEKMSEALDMDASWIDIATQDGGLDWRVLRHHF